MDMYEEFETDTNNETEGVWAELSEAVRLKIRRSGGANKAYETMNLQKMKRYRNRLKGGSIPPAMLPILRKVNRECFSKTVIAGWQTKLNGEWVDGIHGFEMVDGKRKPLPVDSGQDLWPVTEVNILKVLEQLPEMFELIVAFADDVSAFKEEGLEAAEGN